MRFVFTEIDGAPCVLDTEFGVVAKFTTAELARSAIETAEREPAWPRTLVWYELLVGGMHCSGITYGLAGGGQ